MTVLDKIKAFFKRVLPELGKYPLGSGPFGGGYWQRPKPEAKGAEKKAAKRPETKTAEGREKKAGGSK